MIYNNLTKIRVGTKNAAKLIKTGRLAEADRYVEEMEDVLAVLRRELAFAIQNNLEAR